MPKSIGDIVANKLDEAEDPRLILVSRMWLQDIGNRRLTSAFQMACVVGVTLTKHNRQARLFTRRFGPNMFGIGRDKP